MQFAPLSLSHFFVYVPLLTRVFALGTVMSPVFLWRTTGTISIKEQPKEGVGVVFAKNHSL